MLLDAIIRLSLRQKLLVLLAAITLAGWGANAFRNGSKFMASSAHGSSRSGAGIV